MSKFHAQPTFIDGQRFDSKGEAGRYQELKLLEAAGVITDLERQIKYALVVNGVKLGAYVADYRYKENGQQVVEDFKGVVTPVYRLKKKLMKALHGIDILETRA
jgi:hypothetical protein